MNCDLTLWCSDLYGSFRTRTFSEIWPSYKEWAQDWDACELPLASQIGDSKDSMVVALYWLLFSRYANSHLAASDELQGKYRIFSVAYQYGGAWSKRVEIQDKIRALSLEDLKRGTSMIYNEAANPSTEPTTDTIDELTYINTQRTAKSKRDDAAAYEAQLEILRTDVTEPFISKFADCFIKITYPEEPLIYPDVPAYGG